MDKVCWILYDMSGRKISESRIEGKVRAADNFTAGIGHQNHRWRGLGDQITSLPS